MYYVPICLIYVVSFRHFPTFFAPPLTHMVHLSPLLSYLAGSKIVSARPSFRPGYDDKYCSRSYRFVELQKLVEGNLNGVTSTPLIGYCLYAMDSLCLPLDKAVASTSSHPSLTGGSAFGAS